MNKDIVLPSRRFIISRAIANAHAAKVTAMTDPSCSLLIWDWDLLPMARALIEIYEGIEEEKEEYRDRQAREAGEPVKGT